MKKTTKKHSLVQFYLFIYLQVDATNSGTGFAATSKDAFQWGQINTSMWMWKYEKKNILIKEKNTKYVHLPSYSTLHFSSNSLIKSKKVKACVWIDNDVIFPVTLEQSWSKCDGLPPHVIYQGKNVTKVF